MITAKIQYLPEALNEQMAGAGVPWLGVRQGQLTAEADSCSRVPLVSLSHLGAWREGTGVLHVRLKWSVVPTQRM